MGHADDVEQIRRIRQQVEEAENARDAAAFAALFTDDVAMLPAVGEAVHGAREVEEYHRRLYEQGELGVRFHIEDITILGGLAVETGTYAWTATSADGETREGEGRYLYVHERSSDGTWRIHRMSWG